MSVPLSFCNSCFLWKQGICFIRTSRPENPVIYNNNEDFHIGQAKVSIATRIRKICQVFPVKINSFPSKKKKNSSAKDLIRFFNKISRKVRNTEIYYGKICGNIFLQVILKSKDDQVTVIGAGVTLHEALAAAEQLRKGDQFFFFFLLPQQRNYYWLT